MQLPAGVTSPAEGCYPSTKRFRGHKVLTMVHHRFIIIVRRRPNIANPLIYCGAAGWYNDLVFIGLLLVLGRRGDPPVGIVRPGAEAVQFPSDMLGPSPPGVWKKGEKNRD